jgi:hypothetical protein
MPLNQEGIDQLIADLIYTLEPDSGLVYDQNTTFLNKNNITTLCLAGLCFRRQEPQRAKKYAEQIYALCLRDVVSTAIDQLGLACSSFGIPPIFMSIAEWPWEVEKLYYSGKQEDKVAAAIKALSMINAHGRFFNEE